MVERDIPYHNSIHIEAYSRYRHADVLGAVLAHGVVQYDGSVLAGHGWSAYTLVQEWAVVECKALHVAADQHAQGIINNLLALGNTSCEAESVIVSNMLLLGA